MVLEDLLVQEAMVGHDDDRFEDGLAVPLQRDELMGQPCERDVSCQAACLRVLGQVSTSPHGAGWRQPGRRLATSDVMGRYQRRI